MDISKKRILGNFITTIIKILKRFYLKIRCCRGISPQVVAYAYLTIIWVHREVKRCYVVICHNIVYYLTTQVRICCGYSIYTVIYSTVFQYIDTVWGINENRWCLVTYDSEAAGSSISSQWIALITYNNCKLYKHKNDKTYKYILLTLNMPLCYYLF